MIMNCQENPKKVFFFFSFYSLLKRLRFVNFFFLKRISFLLTKWHQIDDIKNWTNYDIKKKPEVYVNKRMSNVI